MTVVRIVKNWDFPNLLRQTPQQQGEWDGITFSLEPIEECDYLVFLNNQMERTVSATCPKENIWAIMQEPYMPGHTDWMAEKHDVFSKVFTHTPLASDPKYVVSHPALPWHVDKTYDQLVAMRVPEKKRTLSWIVGKADDLPGHLKRLNFLKCIQEDRSLPIDLYGRAVAPIDDKWDGLAPYRYSLAVENTDTPDYWTEKIADCFLSWTVPIYYGCSNLDKYFPKESYIAININDPKDTLQQIEQIIAGDSWEKRLPALEEARNLVLNRYQLFPFLSSLIQAQPQKESFERTQITIPPYKRSMKARLFRLRYKLLRHKLRKKMNDGAEVHKG